MNGAAAASLNAERRAVELDRLASGEPVDVLVVGGGISGVGVALDAASRGLAVALIERGDLAQGTSRWSSKLVHGGLRYLAHGDLAIAWEAARERHLLMTRIAPHLTRPLPLLLPLNREISPATGAAAELAWRFGDVLRRLAGTRSRLLPPPRRLRAVEAQRLYPALDDGLRGALLYWDGQLEDDARLVVAVARTAAGHGARILTYTTALELASGGATVRDERTGETFDIAARHVVNATGAWASELSPRVELAPSKGAHIVLPAHRLGHPRAGTFAPLKAGFDRWVLATPTEDGHVLVGVTDDPIDSPVPDNPTADQAEEDLLLQTLNRTLSAPLSGADVVGRFAGVRPLLRGGDGQTADLSRRHAVIEDSDTGVLTLVGGKLTTYRRMAQDLVDRIASRPGMHVGPCRTHRVALVGAAPPSTLRRLEAPARLRRRYGAEAPHVAALAHGRPELLAPLADGIDVLGAELLFGLRHEGALTLDDLLHRRTRAGLVPTQHRRILRPAADLTGLPANEKAPER